MNADKELDVRGLNCPMPILLTRRALDGMADDQVLRITATDPAALKDFQAFSRKTGNVLLQSEQSGAEYRFYIRKKAQSCEAESGGCANAAPAPQCG